MMIMMIVMILISSYNHDLDQNDGIMTCLMVYVSL